MKVYRFYPLEKSGQFLNGRVSIHSSLVWFHAPAKGVSIRVWSIVYFRWAVQSLSLINDELHTFFMYTPVLESHGKTLKPKLLTI